MVGALSTVSAASNLRIATRRCPTDPATHSGVAARIQIANDGATLHPDGKDTLLLHDGAVLRRLTATGEEIARVAVPSGGTLTIGDALVVVSWAEQAVVAFDRKTLTPVLRRPGREQLIRLAGRRLWLHRPEPEPGRLRLVEVPPR